MEGELVKELEVSAAASTVWDIYGSLELTKLSFEFRDHIEAKYEILEGDGGVGTIIQGWLPGGLCFKEKIIKIDNKKYIKEAEMIEGVLLNAGLSFNRVRFEISEKEANSCIIKTTIEYKLYHESGLLIVVQQSEFLESVATTIGKRLCEKKDQTH